MDFENVRLYTCCFLGHRRIIETPILVKNLREVITDLIQNKNVDTFLFGSRSEFNSLCYAVVSELKESYPHIKRIYVRAEFPNINDNYRKYLLERYEYTYYPPKITKAGKAVYVERNYEMIDRSTYCVIYYDEKSKLHPKGFQSNGTRLAYDYALRKHLIIQNVMDV